MSRPPYRPSHQPTEQNKRQVSLLAQAGHKHDFIAQILGISDETLRKYYSRELKFGKELINIRAREKLMQYIEDPGLTPENLNATKFWLERRGGDEFRQTVQVTDVSEQLSAAKQTLAEKLGVELGEQTGGDPVAPSGGSAD